MRWFSLVAAALALAGCSFLSVKGPPRDLSPAGPPECTTSYGSPVADLALAGVAGTLGLVMAIVASVKEIDGDGGEPAAKAAVGALVGSGLFIVSGGYGMVQVSRCRSAHRTSQGVHGGSFGPGDRDPAAEAP